MKSVIFLGILFLSVLPCSVTLFGTPYDYCRVGDAVAVEREYAARRTEAVPAAEAVPSAEAP